MRAKGSKPSSQDPTSHAKHHLQGPAGETWPWKKETCTGNLKKENWTRSVQAV